MSIPNISPNQESKPNPTTTSNEITSKRITVYFNISIDVEIPPHELADRKNNSDLIAYAYDEAIEEVNDWTLSQLLQAVNKSGTTYYDKDGVELT